MEGSEELPRGGVGRGEGGSEPGGEPGSLWSHHG